MADMHITLQVSINVETSSSHTPVLSAWVALCSCIFRITELAWGLGLGRADGSGHFLYFSFIPCSRYCCNRNLQMVNW
uniref:Uncharacterized protein n=1 Tax=Arundo donax TaxID=35708 RepID=A0A0A9CDF4_ARUDO